MLIQQHIWCNFLLMIKTIRWRPQVSVCEPDRKTIRDIPESVSLCTVFLSHCMHFHYGAFCVRMNEVFPPEVGSNLSPRGDAGVWWKMLCSCRGVYYSGRVHDRKGYLSMSEGERLFEMYVRNQSLREREREVWQKERKSAGERKSEREKEKERGTEWIM